MNLKGNKIWTILIPIATLGVVVLHGLTDSVTPNNLLFHVQNRWLVPFFETKSLYFYLHLFAFVPVFALSFDRKVAFYRTWKQLFPALAVVAVVFWIWDIWKTALGDWGFNERYFTFKILNLPIEEWLFFFTFPWAAVFIYACLNVYFPKNTFFERVERPLSIGLVFGFFAVGFSHWGKAYTTTTFIVAGSLLLWQLVLSENSAWRPRFYRAFMVGLIPFVVVNGILTGIATEQPVVVYNPEEYLGLRFLTIPLDDFAYNFALLFAVVWLFEKQRSKS